MKRKFHVRFLGGRVAARLPSHPTASVGSIPITRSIPRLASVVIVRPSGRAMLYAAQVIPRP